MGKIVVKENKITFICEGKIVLEKETTVLNLSKITLNGFIQIEGKRYVVNSKFWDTDEDKYYVRLETEEDIINRHKN